MTYARQTGLVPYAVDSTATTITVPGAVLISLFRNRFTLTTTKPSPGKVSRPKAGSGTAKDINMYRKQYARNRADNRPAKVTTLVAINFAMGSFFIMVTGKTAPLELPLNTI